MGLMNASLEPRPMLHPHDSNRGARAVSPLIRNDLCAQIAPLDRYGLPGLGVALADGLLALVSASKTALCATVGCAEG
jgi:hypothetical protein